MISQHVRRTPCIAALLLLASTLASAAEFNVIKNGAKPDGTTLNTTAIQKTIDSAAAAGGTVVFDKGVYLTGAIFLKSGVELRIDEGVELRGVQDDSAYPEMWTRIAGVEMLWHPALVNVCEQKNVKLTGKGVIDGQGEFRWNKFWGPDQKGGMLKDYTARGLRWAVDYDCRRPRLIQVYKSTDVLVQGLTLKRPGFWTVHVCFSDRVTVDGLTIRANIGGHGPSSDGVDIDSSRNIVVQNCDIDCNDDNICLKAGRDADGLRVNRPTENIIIRDCVTRAGQGLLTFGSETSGGIRNVEAYNLKAVGTDIGIRFKSAKVRGGTVENIVIHDIDLDAVPNPFHFELNWYPSYSYPTLPKEIRPDSIPEHWKAMIQRVEPPERGIPTFRNISISRVTAKNAREAFFANAYAEQPIRNVSFQDVTIDAGKAGTLKHAANWSMTRVAVRTADGQPLKLEDCRNIDPPPVEKLP